MDRYEKGIKVMREHLGPKADEYVEAIREVAPLFAKVNVEFPFGDLYGNKDSVVDQKTRELATIAALTVQGFSLPQLKIHIKCGINCGATKEEIVEIITQMIAYAGFPAATNAIMAAKEVFKELDLLQAYQVKFISKQLDNTIYKNIKKIYREFYENDWIEMLLKVTNPDIQIKALKLLNEKTFNFSANEILQLTNKHEIMENNLPGQDQKTFEGLYSSLLEVCKP